MTFEEYIENDFIINDGFAVLDDDLADVFDSYLTDLSVSDYLTLGQEYGEHVQMCLLTPESPMI